MSFCKLAHFIAMVYNFHSRVTNFSERVILHISAGEIYLCIMQEIFDNVFG